MEKTYTAYTSEGKWDFYATDHKDAMRKALWFCFRDSEELHHVEAADGTTLHIVALTKNDIFALR